ncbi:MAG: hypothetical protein H5T44_01365 [Thermoplasmatales archaeon]|nr:hypothetical protein [Thermoplasmatales archaeon]
MYKLPKEEEIRRAIFNAIRKEKSFNSLKHFRDKILNELKKIDEKYTISMGRARNMIARCGFVKISTKNKKSNGKVSKCPVCYGAIEKIKNLSLLGEKIVIGYRCKICGYRAKIGEIPYRYEFHFTK